MLWSFFLAADDSLPLHLACVLVLFIYLFISLSSALGIPPGSIWMYLAIGSTRQEESPTVSPSGSGLGKSKPSRGSSSLPAAGSAVCVMFSLSAYRSWFLVVCEQWSGGAVWLLPFEAGGACSCDQSHALCSPPTNRPHSPLFCILLRVGLAFSVEWDGTQRKPPGLSDKTEKGNNTWAPPSEQQAFGHHHLSQTIKLVLASSSWGTCATILFGYKHLTVEVWSWTWHPWLSEIIYQPLSHFYF